VQATVVGQELLTIHLPRSERQEVLQLSVPIVGLHNAPVIEQVRFTIASSFFSSFLFYYFYYYCYYYYYYYCGNVFFCYYSILFSPF
jgi:hypothetical protein